MADKVSQLGLSDLVAGRGAPSPKLEPMDINDIAVEPLLPMKIDEFAQDSQNFSSTTKEAALISAASKIPGGIDVLAGGVQSFGALDNTVANLFMVLDKASVELAKVTGLSRGGAFGELEAHFRQRADAIFQKAQPLQREGTGAKVGRIVGGLPVGLTQAVGAASVGGPVAGFGALGALSEADKGPKAALRGGVAGATIGKLFTATAGMSRAARAAVLTPGATAVELTIGGQEAEDAILSGLTIGSLAALTPSHQRTPAQKRVAGRQTPRKFAEQDLGIEPPKVEVEQRPLIETGPKDLAKSRELLGRDFSDLDPTGKAINLNLDRVGGPVELKQMERGLTEIYRTEINEARRGEITQEQTGKLAEDLGMSVQELVSRKQGEAFNAEQLLAARKINQSVLQELQETAARVKAGGGAEDRQSLVRLMALSEGTMRSTLGATAEAGRALQALRIEARSDRARVKQIKDLVSEFEGATGRELETFADMLGELNSPAALSQFVNKTSKATTGDKLMEFWINGLLSAPPTHAANIVSNAGVALYSVPETYLAAGLGLATRNPNRVRFGEGTARVKGLVEGVGDGLRLARKAFVTEESAFDPLSLKVEAMRRRSIEGLPGRVVRLPGRFLMAADDFFKAIGYRQEVNALAHRRATQRGGNRRERAENERRIKQNPSEEIREAGFEAATKQTFTNRLGKTARGFQDIVRDQPYLRVVAPFIKTPVNVFKFAGERTPFGLAMRSVREEIKAGGARRDQALARVGLGSGIMAWTAAKTAEGVITGSGPTNQELRGAWRAAGNQPYSIWVGDPDKIGDFQNGRWVSYARMEPLGTLIGMAADFSEISGHLSENQGDDIAGKIAITFSNNVTSKTFLRGMSSLAEALSDPKRFGQRFVNQLAGSVVPSGIAQINRTFSDPVLRSANDSISAIKRRLPGYSQELPPVRNIWGEPVHLDGGLGPDLISPFYQNTRQPDFVSTEVWRTKAKLRRPDRNMRGVRLNEFEYDALLKETGQLAKQMIEPMVSSPLWSQVPEPLKRETIESVYEKARNNARQQALVRLLQSPRRQELIEANPKVQLARELQPAG